MKRVMLLAAAGVGLVFAGTARADDGGAPVVPFDGGAAAADAGYPPAGAQIDPGTQKYGVAPFLRKAVWWKPNFGACRGCEVPVGAKLFRGHGGNGGGQGMPQAMPGAGVPGYPQAGQPGMGMPGTLVFPTSPFTRSPRDFFMYEKQ